MLTAPCPYWSANLALAPLAVIALLILILFWAFKVRAVLLDQIIASLILILPAVLRIFTSAVARLLDSKVPVISPPLEATVKSVGSIVQVPDFPCGALVLMAAKSPIDTLLAEVSTFPPSPPRLPALALILPLILVVLDRLLKSAMMAIVPPLPLLVGAALALIFPL